MTSLKPSVALTLQPHSSSSSIQGFMIYDEDDQLVLRNEAYLRFYETSSERIVIVNSSEKIVRTSAECGQYEAAIGHVNEWVCERVLQHQNADDAVIEVQSVKGYFDEFSLLISQGHFLEVNASYCEHISELESAEKAGNTAAHIQRILVNGADQFESRHCRKDARDWRGEVAEVGKAVSQMDQVTQQDAAPLEEMEGSSASLKPQAQELVRAVAVFRIAADETLACTRRT